MDVLAPIMYAAGRASGEPDAMPEKRSKITVLLNPEEYVRFEAFCSERGHKKSTLAARLIRDHLDSQEFRPQRELPLDREET